VAFLADQLSDVADALVQGCRVGVVHGVAPLTTLVTRGPGSVRASVRFSVLRPDGLTDVLTVSTDAKGRAAWSYATRVSGTYSITATATAGTETVTSNTVGFTAL
jgi:hypothetical protein